MIASKTLKSLRSSARQGYKRRRDPLPVPARAFAIASILLGSLTSILPFIATTPLMPPFGLLVFIAWRLLRPHLLPNWSGVLFGLFEDLVSGNVLGTAMFLWGSISIALDGSDRFFPWRGFYHDWIMSGLAAFIYLMGAAILSAMGGGNFDPLLLLPQLLITICAIPLVMRLVLILDRWRLGQ